MNKPVIKSVAIEVGDRAFLPEAYVYRDMFRKHGLCAEFVKPGDSDVLKFDAVVLFHGFHPFWRKYPNIIIGEYHSLTVGKFCRIKDAVKRLINVKSDYYIVLNGLVRKKLWLSGKCNLSLRGMGYSKPSERFFRVAKEFDVAYCGSCRDGLIDIIYKIANLGFKVALAGVDEEINHANVVNFGKVNRDTVQSILLKSKYGLNFTPDVFPLNSQDSTKVIEYCGLGLGVITNSYFWVRDFEARRGGRFLYLEDIDCYKDVVSFEFKAPNVIDLEWSSISNLLFDELSLVFEFREK